MSVLSSDLYVGHNCTVTQEMLAALSFAFPGVGRVTRSTRSSSKSRNQIHSKFKSTMISPVIEIGVQSLRVVFISKGALDYKFSVRSL